MVTTLLALDDPEADEILGREKERDHTTDGQKYAYMAEAARPDAATKKKYFDDYTKNFERPEDWSDLAGGVQLLEPVDTDPAVYRAGITGAVCRLSASGKSSSWSRGWMRSLVGSKARNRTRLCTIISIRPRLSRHAAEDSAGGR